MKFGLTQLFGVDETVAVTTAFLLHLAMIVPTVIIGGVILIVDRIPFHDLLEGARNIRQLGTDADVAAEPERDTSA